eukprot:gene5886-5790_t
MGVDCSSAIPACRLGPGVCVTVTGQCKYVLASDGAACDDNDPTTQDSCVAGVCESTAFCAGVTCPPVAACQLPLAFACDPSSGQCLLPALSPDGTQCDDGNPETFSSCQAGTCLGVFKCQGVVCPPSAGLCRTAPVCDPTAGICTSTARPDGFACDDANPDTNDACSNGRCVGTPKCEGVTCPLPGQCTSASSTACVPSTGLCRVPTPLVDGSACNDGDASTVD